MNQKDDSLRFVRLQIKGRVQGVSYRDWMIETARSLGVDGWVRNRRDGSVEVLVQGSGVVVDQLIGLARRGPPAARVTDIDVQPADHAAPAAGFTRRPTA